jgi:hypothetical protein
MHIGPRVCLLHPFGQLGYRGVLQLWKKSKTSTETRVLVEFVDRTLTCCLRNSRSRCPLSTARTQLLWILALSRFLFTPVSKCALAHHHIRADRFASCAAGAMTSLLNSIFAGSPYVDVPSCQSPLLAKEGLEAVVHFLKRSELQAYGSAGRWLDLARHEDRLLLFPQYGCLLLLTPSRDEPALHMSLHCLDEWSFSVHAQLPATVSHPRLNFTSYSNTAAAIDAGCVAEPELPTFRKQLAELIAQAQSRSGDERRAKAGSHGHQKTPTFLLALIQDALLPFKDGKPVGELHMPQGGLTDVGSHTGGAARDTSWPLVQLAAQVAFERTSGEHTEDFTEDSVPLLRYRRFVIAFELHLLDSELAAASLDHAGVDLVMRMLDQIACRSAALADEGRDTRDIVVRLQQARQTLDALVRAKAQQQALQWRLPTLPLHFTCPPQESCLAGLRAASFIPPALAPAAPAAEQASVADLETRSLKNLAWVALNPGAAGHLPEDSPSLLKLLRHARVATDRFCSAVALEAVERAFLQETWRLEDNEPLSCEEAISLEPLFDEYRGRLAAHLLSSVQPCSFEELFHRSRELLVTWCFYSLVEQAASQEWPLVCEYDTALSYQDLRYLSFTDADSQDALLRICHYLDDTQGDGRPIFGHRSDSDDATMDFAYRFSLQDEGIMARWTLEKLQRAQRRAQYWANVQRKLEELQLAEDKLEQARDTVATAKEEGDTRGWSKARMAARIRALDRQYVCEQEVANARTAPAHVVEPLPEDEKASLQRLFFLLAPPLLRLLPKLCFLGQELLVVRDEAAAKSCRRAVYGSSIFSHYQAHSTAGRGAQELAKVRAYTLSADLPPHRVGPLSVTDISDPSQGIWYPTVAFRLCWKEGGGLLAASEHEFDPFVAQPEATLASSWTVRLPAAAASLQWAMPQLETPDPVRGNTAIASPNPSNGFHSREEYLLFAALRAYPHLQLRKLCCALHDRSLPLENPHVQLLVRQMIYQVGALKVPQYSIRPTVRTLVWKRDICCHDSLKCLLSELESLAEELAPKMRSHPALALLAELSAYLRQLDTPLQPQADRLRRRCEEIALGWFQEKSKSLGSSSPEHAASLRLDQSLFCMYAVLSYGGSAPLQPDDAGSLCKLLVHVRQGFAFAKDNPVFHQLWQRCQQQVLAPRALELTELLFSNAQHLAAALRAAVPSLPSDLTLEWKLWTGTSAYVATSPNGALYALNVLTGEVLINGRPPLRLPLEIRSHRTFVRYFGADADYEVVPHRGTSLRTRYATDRKIHEFQLLDSGDLLVRDIPEGSTDEAVDTLELREMRAAGQLEDTAPAAWCADLPPRLLSLFSCWYSPAKQSLLLRERSYPATSVFFVTLSNSVNKFSQAYFSGLCLRVPRHLQSAPWADVLSARHGLTDALLTWTNSAPPLLRVLGKLEETSPSIASGRCHPPTLARFESRFHASSWTLSCATAGYIRATSADMPSAKTSSLTTDSSPFSAIFCLSLPRRLPPLPAASWCFPPGCPCARS